MADALDLLGEPLRGRAAGLADVAGMSMPVYTLISHAVDAAFAGDLAAAERSISEAERLAVDERDRWAANAERAAARRATGPIIKGSGAVFAPSILEPKPMTAQAHPKEVIQAGLRGQVAVPMGGSRHRVIATDGSFSSKLQFPAWGYIADSGQWGCAAATQPLPGNALDVEYGALLAEVCAVGMAVRDVRGPATFLIDSKGVVGMLTAWRAGGTLIPSARADADLTTQSPDTRQRRAARRREAMAEVARMVRGRTDLAFRHCPGHAGHPLNEAADTLAKLAARWRAKGEEAGIAKMTGRGDEIARAFLLSWHSSGATA